MEEIEIERTFLIKTVPPDLEKFPYKIFLDIYLPSTSRHPSLRLRQKGDTYEITKKFRLDENDQSEQREMTIPLTEEEFTELATIPGKQVKKIRYLYPYNDLTAEIDVFQDALAGLVVVDFEFKTSAEKNAFVIPEWCLADVTQEEFIAGGMLGGKTYEAIEEELKKFDYKKLLDKLE
jgi:adenylate cyclase